MTRKSCITITAAILLTAVLIWMAAVVLVPRLLDLDRYRAQILSLVETSLNRQVSYETASFTRDLIPAVVVTGITIKEKTGVATLLTVERLSFRLSLLPLLRKEVHLRGIDLERPVLMLERDQAGVFSLSDLFSGPPSAYHVHIDELRIKNGLIRFTDRMRPQEGFTTALENLDLQLNGLARGRVSGFKLSTVIHDQGGRAELSLSGKVGIPARDVPLVKAKLDVALTAKNLDSGAYWPYYGRFLPFERAHGALDFQGVFKGTLQEFATKGNLRIRGLRLDYPRVFHSRITPQQVDLGFDLELTPRDILAKSIDLRVDGLQVKGSLTLVDIHGRDLHLTVQAVSSPFRLEEVASYIPYGVIPKGTADFIERHIKGGTFRVAEGRLDGRLSQILHMERGTNYNVLLVRATVEQGVMSFGRQVPMISAIKGGLEFRGKDFILSGMTGKFGGSPFSLEGRIADYPLDTPSSYPFTASITPVRAEVAWLLRREKPGQMTFSGPSVLRLSGSGIASDYRISGAWDLSGADYLFPRQLHKPAGLTNRVRFSATLGPTEARLTDLHYELPPLDVTAAAIYRYDDKEPLSCTVASNRFDVGKLLPVIPGLAPYHPAGRLQAAFSAAGNPAAPDSFHWKGEANLAEFSLRPSGRIPPLTRINGTINVSGTVLDTQQLTGRLGDSDVTVTGSVSGFSNPAAEVAFSSPDLHLKDLGYRSPDHDPALKNLAATVSLKDGNLAIASLTGQLDQTSFSLQGEVLDIRDPKITLRVDFPYLRAEDLLPLSGLKPAGGEEGKPGVSDLKVRATAEAGSARGIPFAKLDTELSLKDNRLAVQALSAGAFGGTVSGSGTIDPDSAGGPQYRAQYRLERVDAVQLSRAAGIEPKATGQLTADGELTARGKSQEELKTSASGTARVHMQDGLLHNPRGPGEKIPYRVLDADLTFDKGVFTLHRLSAGVFGGTVSANVTTDPASAGGPQYRVQYRLEGVDAAQLTKAAGMELDLTGQLTADGDLTARGKSPDELKKTARVVTEFELNNGRLGIPAAAGQRGAREIPFKAIQGHLSFEKNVLTVRSARIDAFGGVASGTGSADFAVPHDPGYKVGFTSKSIDSAQLDQAFGFKSDVSGSLALQGELTARGDSQVALKKTVRGSLGMRLENGVINKFSTISKVFSILNVSQLFDWRLPDMVSTGMPYTAIAGNFSFADGIVSTSDLSVNSSSLNMEIVGKADIVKNEIDVAVAVQPLQTVGKIVNRIPVLGWLLTGGDRRLLVTCYQAKGDWNDPTVTSANISELPQGVYNVFKRVFMLPENLITNTNKVLMGN